MPVMSLCVDGYGQRIRGLVRQVGRNGLDLSWPVQYKPPVDCWLWPNFVITRPGSFASEFGFLSVVHAQFN